MTENPECSLDFWPNTITSICCGLVVDLLYTNLCNKSRTNRGNWQSSTFIAYRLTIDKTCATKIKLWMFWQRQYQQPDMQER